MIWKRKPNFPTKIEKKVYDNNLLFYTLLKNLLQCKLSDQKLLSLQAQVKRYLEGNNCDYEEIRNHLLLSEDIVKLSSQTRKPYENFVNLLTDNNLLAWSNMLNVGVDLLLYKDLILQEAKAYTIRRQQEMEAEIKDQLSVQYDATNLCMPYGQRVLGSLLVFSLTSVDRYSTFILEESNKTVGSIRSKIKHLSKEYSINCNNMLILIVDESINQSIKSTAGASYENRVEHMVRPLVSNWKGHSHDKNINAMEYDFTFTVGKKKVGVSAKRTLRERYKQNHEDPIGLDVDSVIVFTLGTDLNEDKLNNILQKDNTYVVVADEVYRMHSYLQNNRRVISSRVFVKCDEEHKRLFASLLEA